MRVVGAEENVNGLFVSYGVALRDEWTIMPPAYSFWPGSFCCGIEMKSMATMERAGDPSLRCEQ